VTVRSRTPSSVWVVLGVLGIVLVAEGAWTSYERSEHDAATATTSSPAATVSTEPVTTTTSSAATTGAPAEQQLAAPPPSSASLTLAAHIAALAVAEPDPQAGYSSSLFPHWNDADHNGCDTRCEVLARQKRYDLPGLPSGGWLSVYDGYSTDNPSELDIDHVVPLSEAWVSGADRWDAATLEAFANDLDSRELVAVTASTNRSKGDQDPASWQPSSRGDWCDYVTAWVTVKQKWGLTADQAEVNALMNMSAAC
jgi:hypothetical protein